MTCYKCGKEHTTVVCPPRDFWYARGCSPPESDLTPEGAIRRGRGADDVEQWIEEANHLREVVKDRDKFIDQMGKKIRRVCDKRDLYREALETISSMACYASEEDTDSRAEMLLHIGECARNAIHKTRGQ